MPSIAEYDVESLEGDLLAWGYKPSHALRLLRSYYDRAGVIPWDELKLPEGLRERLLAEHPLLASEVAMRQVAEDGTTKLLLRFPDGRAVESVMMTDYREDRVAGCLSSQAGCAMGCDFCATAQGGLERNLTSGEIVEQFLRLRAEAAAVGRKLRTVVFMGMGEPMHNLPNVLAAIRRIGCDTLGAHGWRQITVSTVGIVPGIDALAAEGLRLNLAVSLHAPDDATRARLLPTSRRYTVSEIMAAMDRYQARSGLPAIIQYCLLKGVNDSLDQARQLADLLASRRMHVNLLHYNATGKSLSGTVYETTSREQMNAFIAILRERGVVAHVRRPRGREIAAACGQLRDRAGGCS
ncbi:MAG: 23S rRNA (adenine(2503)-C(2))-methyltransferase RlmN [Opitutaceae bacterium]|jgi:23S rRNA (adenine2503-C2)-methyltransferase